MKMKYPLQILFLLLFLGKTGFSQNKDSLKLLLKKNIHDTTRCIILNTLVELENDVNIWPGYNSELKTVVLKNLKTTPKNASLFTFYKKHLSGVLNNEGFYYRGQGDIQKALDYYLESLKVSEEINDKQGVAQSLNNVGFVYYNLGDIPRSVEYFQKALRLMEEMHNEEGIGTALNNLASIYDGQGDIVKAIEFYERALAVHEKNKNLAGQGYTLNNIGLIYHNNRQYSKALKYFYKAMTVQKEIGDKSGYSTTINNIGLVYRNLGDKTRALEYYLRSLRIQEEISDKAGILYSLNNLGALYAEMGNTQKAEEYCNQSLEMSKELGFPENIKNAAKILNELYAKKGSFKEAYKMQSLYYVMRDSVLNDNNRKVSIKSQIKYAYEQKALADSIRTMEEKKVTVAQLKQERTQRYSLYGGLALTALFGSFMFNRFRVTRKQKEVIEIKSRETEMQKSIIEEHRKEIIDSINYAKRIQGAILPPQRMIKELLIDAFVLYLPKDIVAGDFYWLHSTDVRNEEDDSRLVFFAAADCTGHGVPGAMVSVVCNNALNRAVKEFGLTDPGLILDKAREILILEFEKSDEEVKDGMDISLCVLDFATGELAWAGANNPLWVVRNGSLIEKRPNKQPIGKFIGQAPFTTHKVQLWQDDMVYIFTDGYADQFGGPNGKKFMYKNLRSLLIEISSLETNEQKIRLKQTLESWKGGLDQVDDICVIGVRV
jgi:tetratricopeptide (TPR) repeat protein